MPTPRVTMRNIKELLRLKFDCGLSHERIGRALQDRLVSGFWSGLVQALILFPTVFRSVVSGSPLARMNSSNAAAI